MSNYDQIGRLFDAGERLGAVRYSMFDVGSSDGQDWIDAVELQFEGGTIASIYVDSEFDCLRLEFGEIEIREQCYAIDASGAIPWAQVLGRNVSWIWLLTNHQGYEDGLRLEFSGDAKDKEENIVTLIGIASKIEVFSSTKVSLWF